MVSYVEYGVEFTETYGDIDEKFYLNIARMFAKACEYISDNDLENSFKERCEEIMENSQSIGWGFGFEVSDIYCSFFFTDDE